MPSLLRISLFLTLLFCNFSVLADSIFHSLVTDLSPPYSCKLKLNTARGVSLDTNHSYHFTGICSVKIPVGNAWIYQNLWVDLNAAWSGETHDAIEQTTVLAGDGNRGTIVVAMKCDDDPWLTKAQCVLDVLQNNTNFSNFGKVYNQRNGLYPPFEIITGQYPPLARNQAILQDAIALSLLAARQEAGAANAAFEQAFGKPITSNLWPERRPRIIRRPRCRVRRVIGHPLNCSCFGRPACDRTVRCGAVEVTPAY